MENTPAELPDEKYKINPESLEVTNVYLSCLSVDETAKTLGIAPDVVSQHLAKPEVERFIATVFLDKGYANQFKLQGLMDEIIASKLEEAEVSEVYTNKDLLDVLALQHKMRMDYINKLIKLEEVRNKTPANQTNVQVNSYGDNFSSLLDRIIKQ